MIFFKKWHNYSNLVYTYKKGEKFHRTQLNRVRMVKRELSREQGICTINNMEEEKVKMKDLAFQRGAIVAFTEKEQKRIAVNIQNGAGNRFAPTIIVAQVELIPIHGMHLPMIFPLQDYPSEGVCMVVNLGKIKTIDKKRVDHVIGQLPMDVQKDVDQQLQETFCFEEDQQGQVVFVNLGKDIMGSEHGGERPAIVLKEFKTETKETYFLVALMTSKMSKRAIPTHVLYEEGEGGIAKPSLALFEQLKYVKTEDVISYYEYTPSKKLPNIKKAFHISVGLSEKIKSGA